MSDGIYFALTEAELNVTPSVLSISKRKALTVHVGAAKMEGHHPVKVAWWSCGAEVASDNPVRILEFAHVAKTPKQNR